MLNNRSWITENNELYTPMGWIPVKNINYVKSVLGVVEGRIVETKIQQYNIYKTSTKIPKSKSKHFIHGKLIYPNDCLWLVDDCQVVPKSRLIQYTGNLYNIVTECNNLFIRTVFKEENNFDYTLIQCVK